MDYQQFIICKILETRDISPVLEAGITRDYFPDPDARKVFELIVGYHAEYGAVPEVRRVKKDYPRYDLISVAEEPYAALIDEIQDMRDRSILERTLAESVEQYDRGNTTAARRAMQEGLDLVGDRGSTGGLVTLSDVEPESVEWLWDGFFPKGMLSVIDGDPGSGKSTFTLDLAARVSTGATMPDGSGGRRQPADVLLINVEDPVAQVIRPRLDAAGANVSRVHILSMVPDEESGERPISLKNDVELIERVIRKRGVGLVIIDPLMAFLESAGRRIDSHKDQDMRPILSRMSKLAEETGATFVVIRHMPKNSSGGKAIYAGGGSIGIIGAARAGYIIGRDPGDPDIRVMACAKINVGPEPTAMAYRLVSDPDKSVGRVDWIGPWHLTADELVAGPKSQSKGDRAEEWLTAYLGDQPDGASSKQVKEDAKKAGISEMTLKRAAQNLGVKMEKKKEFPSGTVWKLSNPFETASDEDFAEALNAKRAS
ncbi:AAA family ATPase [Pseudofrankia sp. BMG5.37]|uniref:AAA family ATPase n=1 Tax=Pseudofrankia sp. BMG5.37 TaxID=3050035 RepID=UPI002893F3C8|nr:AAA family ATPase [Pseudofrankia sp. BMG5.37]MDT3441771.1 AAA family ATPase [Pseudofrankia sp. BMG5.37]